MANEVKALWVAKDRIIALDAAIEVMVDENNRLTEENRKLRRFAEGAIFTMSKAKKHNDLSSHDGEMFRQRIIQGKELLGNLK